MHIHILGICGTFMGGLAALAREAGHRVTGCDAGVYPPMSDQLRALGIDLIEGYGAEQIELKPDLFVVGNVVSRGNPLIEAVMTAGAAYTSGPQWLADHVLQGRHVLAVAGTHGKTTTSAMLAWVLDRAGLEPGFLIGGVPLNFGVSARLGKGNTFVIEADEYDTAFFDKRSKFVHYRPRTAILNNLEFDHADIFDDLPAIERQFHHLVRTVPANGRLVVNAREPALQRVLAQGCWSELVRFGARKEEPGALRARGEPHAFDVLRSSLKIARVDWSLLGEHNQMNALATIGAAEHVGVSPARAAEALGSFESVKRRLELLGEIGGVKVYDDFAHHPTAMRSTINGLRRKVGPARILAVFEPRSNTMKLGTMKAQLPWSLEEADLSFCHSGGLGWNAAEAMAPLGKLAVVSDSIDVLVSKSGCGCQARRPCAVHEQRRVRRNPRQADEGHGRKVRRHGLISSTPAVTPTHLLYLHGFRSSPKSAKSTRMAQWMAAHRPDVHWWCPQLPPSPKDAVALIEAGLADWPNATMAAVGSSLGGFYATVVAERHGCPAVLLNPAVDPARDLARHIGVTTAWHSDEAFWFKPEYVDELKALRPEALTLPSRYLAVIAKGDEVLDWHEMSGRYAGSPQLVLEGSDHALSNFDEQLPEVLHFLGFHHSVGESHEEASVGQ